MTIDFPHLDTFQHFETIDSTNAEAWRFVRKHPDLNALFVADEQTAGRGRQQREWQSPEGKGLWWSLLLGRKKWFPENAHLLSLYTGLITKYALSEWTNASIQLKWPNDIYAEGKKISGILIESKWQGNQPLCYIIGIGINLRQQPNDFPPEIRNSATSLAQLPLLKEIHRPDLLAALVDQFFKHWELIQDPDKLVQEWMASAQWLGEPVELLGGETPVEGIFRGINATGQALVETSAGTIAITAGDLSLRKKQ